MHLLFVARGASELGVHHERSALLHELLDRRILVSAFAVYGESGKIVQKVRARLPKITLRLPSKTGRFCHFLRILQPEASEPC